jgi:hypothetical protein
LKILGPAVEASRTQRLICNKMQHGNTRLVKCI